MSDLIKDIQTLETTVQKNKTELAKLEERQKMLTEERNKLLASLKVQGISEDDLEDDINTLESELTKKIEEIKNELR